MKFLASAFALLILISTPELRAQSAATGSPRLQDAKPPAVPNEQRELNEALQEAGNSPVDFIRALEKHLRKYPDSKERDKIERAIVRAAMDSKDNKRVIQYGERVLEKDTKDVQVLEKVASALLARGDKESAERSYGYAKRLEQELQGMRDGKTPEGYSEVRWKEQIDRRMSTTLRFEAQAQVILGKGSDAAVTAKRGWDAYPSAEGARAWAQALVLEGKPMDAIAHFADAFTLEDPESTEADRERDRAKMGELYAKAHGSETGLGDVILQGYDRTTAMMADRLAKLRAGDPNSQAKTIMDFTLPAVHGDSLKMQSLKGKTVVVDFWATWCGPCRQQRPLYELVAKKYAANPNVVFLSVTTDEDHSLVAPFMQTQKWDQMVYFEAGLSSLLRVQNIPTTIVLDREGQIASRISGFIPDRFVDMLTSRIDEALQP